MPEPVTIPTAATRQALIAALVRVQNHPANHGRDIVTITGMMSVAEVAAHLAACRAQIGEAA